MNSPEGQGAVLMRKRAGRPTTRELEEPEENEPPELAAARSNIQQLTDELVPQRTEHEHLASAWRAEASKAAAERKGGGQSADNP
jgi:hypothetical protein